MDCSICLETITKQTGLVTLSCEHSFHFRCIDSWFTKQIWDNLEQTCPCCRSKGDQMDRCEVHDDEESYETESDASSESMDDDDYLASLLMNDDFILERNVRTGQFLITPATEVSLMHVRNLFGPLNDLDYNEPSKEFAARKIQAVYRGYKARTTFETQKAAHTLMLLFLEAYAN